MDRTALQTQIVAILADVLMIEDSTTLRPDAHIVRDLGAESINIAEITVALENEFDLFIEDDQMRQVATVEALVDFVEKSILARSSQA